MINVKRLLEEFCKLVSIDSTSFKEREMADYLKKELSKIGVEIYEDNAGDYYNSNTGNLYCRLKGNTEGEPVLFSAHMDTVEPGAGKKAVVHSDGSITSEGNTVLGADDMSGVAAIIEALRTIKENNISHRDIELLFPIAEETYIKGTNVFDFNRIKSKTAYILDLSGETGRAALQAPSLISFTIEVKGKAAHAGFSPEKGINAIAAAAYAISNVRQGKIDSESTLNIGTIEGGTGTNIISESCIVKGELRSLEHNKALNMLNSLKSVFEDSCKNYNAELKFYYNIDLKAYKTDKNSITVERYERACNALGINTEYISTFGGSDNNNFAKNGIEGIVVGCGYNNAHSCQECINVSDLEKLSSIVLKLMTM